MWVVYTTKEQDVKRESVCLAFCECLKIGNHVLSCNDKLSEVGV